MEVMAALLIALSSQATAAGAAARPPMVLFVCPHGAAKSVMADAYFQKLAKERGLIVRADAAGSEPQADLATNVVAHLTKNGYAIPIAKPRGTTAADMTTADVVVSMGSDLSKLPPARGELKQWDVPDFSAGFDQAEQAIRLRVTALVDELMAKQKRK